KFGMPQNYATKRNYSGFNPFWLSHIQQLNNYKTPYWLTFKQVNELGGKIIRGEKATSIMYYINYINIKNEENGTEKSKKKVFIPKEYFVFNLDQVTGIDFDSSTILREKTNSIESCEDIIELFINKPLIGESSNESAFYAPIQDMIAMPP